MRIWLIVGYEPVPGIDGNVRFLRFGELGETLATHGHEVTWWTSDFDHIRKCHRNGRSKTVELQPNLHVTFLSAPSYKRNVSLARIMHNIILARSFENEVKRSKIRPDILFVCLHPLELSQKAVEFGHSMGIPVVVDVYDKWPDIYLTTLPQRLHGLARLALIFEYRRAKHTLQSASAITAVSNTYLQWGLDHAKRLEQNVDAVFPLGYSKPKGEIEWESKRWASCLKSDYGINPEALIVTFVGQFGASYDLETVIKAARQLKAEAEERVQFVLVGDGDKSKGLTDMAKDLPNVVFTGWLEQPAVWAILGMSSVGLASYSDRALQSLPYKPFEYMAAGLPILSSLKGEFEALVRTEEFGRSYKAGNVASMVEALRWFVDNPIKRKVMGRKAQQVFEERFNSEGIYTRLVDHLKKIAKQ